MSGVTKEELKEALAEVIKPRNSAIDEEVHKTHHAYVQLLIERRARNARYIERFTQSWIGAAATGIAVAMIWVGKLVIDAFSHGS